VNLESQALDSIEPKKVSAVDTLPGPKILRRILQISSKKFGPARPRWTCAPNRCIPASGGG
jgi:hypothetical protein